MKDARNSHAKDSNNDSVDKNNHSMDDIRLASIEPKTDTAAKIGIDTRSPKEIFQASLKTNKVNKEKLEEDVTRLSLQ